MSQTYKTVNIFRSIRPEIFRIAKRKFKPGERSATLQNSVVRAERDLYQINARGGQEMMLKIQSLEKNAVFDLVSPSGLILVQSASQKQILLQETGNYQVIVGGTRGNATYSLRISIN